MLNLQNKKIKKAIIGTILACFVTVPTSYVVKNPIVNAQAVYNQDIRQNEQMQKDKQQQQDKQIQKDKQVPRINK